MLFIALLAIATVAAGAVLGAKDQLADLLPRVYQNTTCTETDDNRIEGASADVIDQAIKVLKNSTDQCSQDPSTTSCQSLYCKDNASVLWCNVGTQTISMQCADFAAYLWSVRHDCSHRYPNTDFTGVWGRATDDDGWYLQVQGDPINCYW
ncbi:hypothetical protein PG996_011090 [Apiospora saccharicola]|uniref:Uncharacterized protein n=1 Tax=Apiospora saccharicola TaxID=335842 RepID=A0ABR1UGU6_9PEZI